MEIVMELSDISSMGPLHDAQSQSKCSLEEAMQHAWRGGTMLIGNRMACCNALEAGYWN